MAMEISAIPIYLPSRLQHQLHGHTTSALEMLQCVISYPTLMPSHPYVRAAVPWWTPNTCTAVDRWVHNGIFSKCHFLLTPASLLATDTVLKVIRSPPCNNGQGFDRDMDTVTLSLEYIRERKTKYHHHPQVKKSLFFRFSSLFFLLLLRSVGDQCLDTDLSWQQYHGWGFSLSVHSQWTCDRFHTSDRVSDPRKGASSKKRCKICCAATLNRAHKITPFVRT